MRTIAEHFKSFKDRYCVPGKKLENPNEIACYWVYEKDNPENLCKMSMDLENAHFVVIGDKRIVTEITVPSGTQMAKKEQFENDENKMIYTYEIDDLFSLGYDYNIKSFNSGHIVRLLNMCARKIKAYLDSSGVYVRTMIVDEAKNEKDYTSDYIIQNDLL